MKNNSTKSSNRKINWKKVGVILLIILAIISVFGIIFSSLSFAKDIDNNNSRDIGDKLQITYNVSLDINKNDKDIFENNSSTIDEKNSAKDRIARSIESQLRNVSNSFYEQAKRQDINDFEITYGVPRHNSFSFDQEGNPIYQTFPEYGEVNLILSANDPGLDFNETIALSNYEDNETEIKKDANSSLTQQLKYFYRFANTYDLKLINLTKSEDSNYGLKPFYQLNKDNNVVYDSSKTTGTIKLDDRVDTIEYGRNWNFKELQEEFVKVVDVPVDTSSSGSDSSDGTTNPDGSSTPETPTTRDTETTTYWQQSDYDDEKAATSFLESKQFTEAPKNQYIIWSDRSDLIFRLQISTLAAKLWNIAREFEANSKLLFIATNLIKSLSIYEQDFGFWLANNNNILIDLINQNSLSPSYWNGSSNPRDNDNLLRLLNEYYGTTGISVPDDSSDIQLSDEDKKTITEYKTKNQTNKSESKFLYSWNLESNELINKSLISIDYGNFFKFFENNNAEWMEENEEKSVFYSENYFTKNFKIVSEQIPSEITFENYTELLNKASVNSTYFNSSLVNLFNLSLPTGLVKSSVLGIVDYLSIYSQTSLNTITTLPTYVAAFIGILAIILIIGIVVSILYRVPGFVAAITTTLSFAISCLVYSSLGLSFSFGSYLLLTIITILAYIPIIYILDYMKFGIKKGYNLWNAFKYALRRFTKIALGIYISLLIFGIVFMFFGFLQIQSFGVLLVISSLFGILFNGAIYALVIWAIISVIEHKYNTLFSKKYVEALNIIRSTTFQSFEIASNENNNSILSKISKTVDIRTKSKNWLLWLNVGIALLAIVGLTLLLVFGPGFSLNYSNGTLISLISEKELPQNIINDIVNKSNMNLFDIQVNTSSDYTETILIFANTNVINWTNLSEIINGLDADKLKLITNFSILENNTTTSYELTDNVIKCLFISFGFITIWSLLWLNIVNIIPVILLESFNVFVVVGIVGASRIPFSVNSLVSSLVLIVFFSSLVFGLFSDLKVSYNYKKSYSKDELCNHVVQQSNWSINKYTFAVISYFLANLIFLIFVSETFWNSLFISMLMIFVLYFVNYYFTPTLFTLSMLVKKFFSQERHRISIRKYLQNVESGSEDKNKDFDKVDEQEIYGLNKFRIKEMN